jgi:S-DNA-T family DNA segregation ATPase FtsK/SpoIIIE
MLITLITQEKIHTLALPEKIEGRYWLFDPALPQVRPLAIEAEANEWVLQSNRYVYLPDMKQVALRPHTIYTLYCQADQKQEIHIYVEPITEDRKTYKKLAVRSDDQEIKIGRERGNIIVNNRYVSSEHAKLICFKGQWSVFDEQSTNGTFVNGKRVASSNLSVGDVIYIMGFKIIIGGTFLALNNPDGQVNLPSHLPVYKTEVAPLAEDEEYEELPQEYFYRSPRFKRDLEKAEIRIDPPPQTPVRDELPVMLTVGPAMTMGMASMTTAIFAVNRGLESGNMSSAIPSIVMSCSMLLGSLLWPTLSRRYEKRRQRRLEGVRQEKYREYLQTLADRFKNECAKQKEILLENHVTLGNCLDRISEQKRDLWERGPGQNDFLTLRLGLGNGKLQADLAYPEKRFSLADDDLEAELYKLCESPKDIKEIPITISLWDNFIMGVIGARRVATEFARGLIMQIASLYSYDEVKLVFILSPDEEEDFRFTKWLPHAWDDEHNFRFLAANESEMKEVSARLEKEWEKRLNLNEREREDIAPYYVIFSLNKNLARMADGLKQIYQSKEKLGVSVVTFYDELRFLPKECTKVVEVERNNGKIFDKNDI